MSKSLTKRRLATFAQAISSTRHPTHHNPQDLPYVAYHVLLQRLQIRPYPRVFELLEVVQLHLRAIALQFHAQVAPSLCSRDKDFARRAYVRRYERKDYILICCKRILKIDISTN